MARKRGKKNWIAGAIKNKGALRKSLGAKPGETIPAGKLAAAAKKPGKLGRRARLAITLKKMGGGQANPNKAAMNAALKRRAKKRRR